MPRRGTVITTLPPRHLHSRHFEESNSERSEADRLREIPSGRALKSPVRSPNLGQSSHP